MVVGVATNDVGIAKDGSKRENFQRGVELRGICSGNFFFFLHHSFQWITHLYFLSISSLYLFLPDTTFFFSFAMCC